MHTWLFVATPDTRFSLTDLDMYAQLMKKWMPALNVELTEGYGFLPEWQYGWMWIAPAGRQGDPLISQVIDSRYAVLVFGEIFNGGAQTAAQIIGETWVAGGASGVRQLDGCFSAIIVNRPSGEVLLIGDIMGRRRLCYYASGEALFVSPHDVTLMAGGAVSAEWDVISAGSVTGMEWSLGGRSLLKHVQTCSPTEYLRWHQGHMQKTFDPVIDPSHRIHAEDGKEIAENLNHMIEIARQEARIFIGKRPDMHCDLSAGFDSRVVWSLLLSVIDNPARIMACSGGEVHSLDVEVAKRLAGMYGTGFVSQAERPPTPDEFLTRLDLLAFAMNGGTPGKRAMKHAADFTFCPQVYASGNGGEIYRGYYYHLEGQSHLSMADILTMLHQRSRIGRLPWSTPDVSEAVHARLNELVESYAGFSRNGFDILDMFYLHERMGVWGAATARQTWKNPRWSPFMSSQIIRMAFQMPSPIARFATIHREILRRFTPKAYRIRINGREWLPLDDWGAISPWLKAIDKIYLRIFGRVQRILQGCQPVRVRENRNMDHLASEALSSSLLNVVGDLLLSDGSFSKELYGQSGVELLLREQQQRRKDHTEVLGLLAAMERWRNLVQAVGRDASKELHGFG